LNAPAPIHWRRAGPKDVPLLAALNHQLIQDERHRNPMTVPQLEERMRNWLHENYTAMIFEDASGVVAYALYREQPEEIYLRHFFVVRHRRRQGLGRRAIHLLFTDVWPTNKRLTVNVLTANTSGIAFWRSVGFVDYCLTLEIVPKTGG